MNNDNQQLPDRLKGAPPDTLGSLKACGRWIDDEVAKGRDVDEVLDEGFGEPAGYFWFDPENMRHFSTAVEDTFKTSPIPVRMSQRMRLALESEARKSKLPRSEVMRQLLQEALVKRGYQVGV